MSNRGKIDGEKYSFIQGCKPFPPPARIPSDTLLSYLLPNVAKYNSLTLGGAYATLDWIEWLFKHTVEFLCMPLKCNSV